MPKKDHPVNDLLSADTPPSEVVLASLGALARDHEHGTRLFDELVEEARTLLESSRTRRASRSSTEHQFIKEAGFAETTPSPPDLMILHEKLHLLYLVGLGALCRDSHLFDQLLAEAHTYLEHRDPETERHEHIARLAEIHRVNENLEVFLPTHEIDDPLFATDPIPPADHPPFSDQERQLLTEIGLAPTPLDPVTRNSLFAQSRRDLLQLLDESLTVDVVAERLRVSDARIRQRLGKRELVGIKTSDGWRLPELQFHEHEIVPGLTAVNRARPESLHVLSYLDFLRAPNTELRIADDQVSPLTWLSGGGSPERIIPLIPLH